MSQQDYARPPRPSREATGQTAIRLALLKNGYVPLPAIGKQCKMRDWPRVPVNEKFIRHIGRSALYTGTGLRIHNKLIVFDIDTDIEELADAIEDAIAQALPDFMKDCVVRHSGGASFALFGRCNTATIGRLSTARYKLDGKGRNHAVEIFGPNSTKFVALDGPHTIRDGVVVRRYGFHGPALWEVPYGELPVVSDRLVVPLLNALEAVISAYPGMERTQPEHHADRGFAKIYDLEEDDIMRLEDGTQETLASLGQRLAGGGYERGYANIWDPGSTTPDRCRVGVGGWGVYVIDWKQDETHHLASHKPLEPQDLPNMTAMAKRLKETAR